MGAPETGHFGGDGELALGLNRMVRAVLPKLPDQGCRVVHLTGERS